MTTQHRRRKRSLGQVQPEQERLGQSTIMDRELAARFGVPYVHLAVIAIDVDRAFRDVDDELELPFGWEVWLTRELLVPALAGAADPTALLEETCLAIMERGEDALGSQVVFAVYAAVAAGTLPSALQAAFRSWRKPPTDLMASLEVLDADRPAHIAALSELCLGLELVPPLAEPTCAALEALAAAASTHA